MSLLSDLKGKVVVITGGGGLLGKELASAVYECNGTAIIADIDSERGEKVAFDIQKNGHQGDVDFLQVDTTSKSSLLKAIENLAKKHGRIDALVNNAYPRNKNYGRHFFDVEYKDFCENINLNIGGYFLASQQFANFFIKNGGGTIINIASIYGIVAPKFEIYEGTTMTMPVEYAAIKSSLILLTKYMAKFFKGMNIRVNCISPGGITDGQPDPFLKAYNQQCLSKGMLEKGDIKGTLIYLLSDMSKFVNGQNIIVDDGFTL